MTRIEWANEAINPIIGCSKESAGCLKCYAERMAVRLAGNPATPQYKDVISGGKWNGKTAFVPSVFDKLETWKKSKRIFVGSMGDVFHESVPFEWQKRVYETTQMYPQHSFLFLTKRVVNMAKVFGYFDVHRDERGKNIWCGVTVESPDYLIRIDELLRIPAKVRYISVEPMLSEVIIPLRKLSQLQWVICGAETGQKARRLNPEWVMRLRADCKAVGVPFFFKKWGLDSCHFIDGELDGEICRAFPKE